MKETHLSNTFLDAQQKMSCDFTSTDHVIRKMEESERYVRMDVRTFLNILFEKYSWLKNQQNAQIFQQVRAEMILPFYYR